MRGDSRFNKFLTIKYFYGVVVDIKDLLIKLSVAGFSAATLVASGVTTGSTGSGDAPFQTLPQAHAANKTFSGDANGAYYSPSTGIQFVADSSKFSIVANSSGGFDAVLDGENFSFSSADYDSSLGSYVKKLTSTRTVALAVSLDSIKYKYAGLLGAEFENTATGYRSIGFANYGIETISMPSTSSALFTGDATMIIGDKTTGLLYSYKGDVSLTANFSTNKVGGNILNLTNTVDATKIPGQLNIEDGNITHNEYVANLNGSTTLNSYFNTTITGKLQGGFYGPNADETAGKFTLSTPNSVTIGAFVAKQ